MSAEPAVLEAEEDHVDRKAEGDPASTLEEVMPGNPADAAAAQTPPTPVLCTNWESSAVPDLKVIPMPVATTGDVVDARSLFDLAYPSCEDNQCLLGNRYLCRGGGMLLLGPTGIGKSACVMQCSICWSVGRAAFGIVPAQPLKILLIQAENDDGDLAEMRDGVVAGLGLQENELNLARQNMRVVTEDARTGIAFILMLAQLLATEQPDLVIIDPAFAYVGGSVTDQAAVTAFLRTGLTPLLRRYGCGALILHHTNKPPVGKEKSGWQAGDFAYAGGGSSEWANWARAVILIRSLGLHDTFELRLAKRGGRVGWKEADGVTARYTTLIGHSKVAGQIFWRELTCEEAAEQGVLKVEPSQHPEVVMAMVPLEGTIPKEEVINSAKQQGMGQNKMKKLIKELIATGALFEWRIPRPGTRPAVHLARERQS